MKRKNPFRWKGARAMWAKAHNTKRAHPTQWAAWEHVVSLGGGRNGLAEQTRMNVYACRWGGHWECGQTAPEHWHVGHIPGSRAAAGHPHHPSTPCGPDCGGETGG